MLKKLLALLMVLMLLPLSAAHADAVDDHGSIEAAMADYAKKALRSSQYHFSQMTNDNVLAFRMAIDKVYGREGHSGDKNKLHTALTTLGFTVTENDSVWLIQKNQVELNLRYLLYLTQLETMPFEDAVENIATYMPDYDIGRAALGVAGDIFLNLLGGKLGEMVQADGIVYALEFRETGKQLLKGNFFSRTLGKALISSSGHWGDIFKSATTMSDAAKSLTGYVAQDPALLNLINSTNQALSGAAYLETIYTDSTLSEEMASACQLLSDAYSAYLALLDELGQRDDAHELLQDEAYLAYRFDQILQNKLAGYSSVQDACTAILAGAATLYDVIANGGLGSIIVKGGTNVVGEAVFGTVSTFSHFHAMETLDEIYAAVESATNASCSTWEEYAAYARNIQRLCNIALLGESHIYQLTTEDIGAGQKLYNLINYKLTGEDILAQNTQWYEQRIEYLQGVYSAAQAYLEALYAHYDELQLEFTQSNALLGAENSLTTTIKGEITQDKWFALPDGSGPNFDNPNPDAGKPVEGIRVALVYNGGVEDIVLADTFTNAKGEYTLTYPVMTAAGKQLSLTIGDDEQDDYLVKEDVSALNHRWTNFRSSFRWNPETETLAEQTAGDESFPLPYADDLFIGSSLEYDHNLAIASLGLAAAAMSDPDADSAWTSNATAGRDGNIRAAWSSLGYSVVASGGYNQSLNTLQDNPAYTIAVKTFEDPDVLDENRNPKQYRVVGVAIRGDVDTAELAQTLIAAEADATVTGSYRSAAMAILPALEKAVNDGWQPDIPTKVWITGFSRGGAIAGQLCDLVTLRSALSSKISGLYGYTFAAPGGSKSSYSAATSTSGIFNIVYEEDLVATGLLSALRSSYANPGTGLTFGASDAGNGRKRIASAFHMLTGGNSAYDPMNYTADPTVRTFFRHVSDASRDIFYADELQPLVTALMQISFLRNDAGDDFRTLSLMDKHEQTIAITGHNRVVLNATSTAQDTLTDMAIEEMMPAILNGAQATYFKALPLEAQESLTAYMGDVLRLAALNSGKGSAFRLSDDTASIFLSLVLALSDDFSAPTAQYSSLYGHHPEIYMAWMLGHDSRTLFSQELPERFNTPVLPVEKNLLGTVIDAESKKPLVNVPVHIVGGVGEDAIDRTILTDDKGQWDTYVKPANYTVTFELAGYYPHVENVAQSQLEIDKVELETELVPMDHNAIVITTVSRFETAEHARIDISHPYVYSEANPKLGDAVEAAIGSIFTKRHAEADKTLRTAQSCTYHRTSAHTEHAYMTHVYATDTVLCMNISTGYYVCSIGHQCTTTRSYVFDIATGKRLNLADMLDPANPNAKKDFQAVMTQICKEKNLPCNASKMFNLANKYDQNTNWYLLNDGIYMDYEFISSGYQGFFIPYEQLVGILRPDCLPVENIGSAQVKAVRIENILDDYDGQLIYSDYGTSSTGVQLDGLVSHIWVNDRAYDPNTARGRYFYGYKVKDVTAMMPPHEDSVGVVWTDYLGDHFATLEPLPEPEPAEDEYLP